MRYFAFMVMLVSALMAMAAVATAPTPARRFAGASATVTVSARLIRGPARVGPGLGPPLPRMAPRQTMVSAADGRPVAALVYDFE